MKIRELSLMLALPLFLFAANVGDTVWIDSNENWEQDAGEVGYPGVTVILYNNAGGKARLTKTDAKGKYRFTGVKEGDYQVAIRKPKDAEAVTPLSRKDIYVDKDRTDIDFGLIKKSVSSKYSLGDTVWNDLNENWEQDRGELGYANVIVELYNTSGKKIKTTRTDSNGKYKFSNLEEGDYNVGIKLPANTKNITPTILKDIYVSKNRTDIDFGLIKKSVSSKYSLGDTVWNDLNENWEQDRGELGYANVIVELYNTSGKKIQTTRTDSNGKYKFSNLAEGDYDVGIQQPNNSKSVTPTIIRDIYVSKNRNDIDFGLLKTVYDDIVIGDTVWNDLNENWEQDAGEPGYPDVKVELYTMSGKKIKTTKTDSAGHYKFINLQEGDYKVTVIKPKGAEAITPLTREDIYVDKARNDIDFGIKKGDISIDSKVYAYYADEHNTADGTGNRILQIDIDTMTLANELAVPGNLGHHADNTYNSKIYGVPKGSNYVNVIAMSKDKNGKTSMKFRKKIPLIHKPRSSDAYNGKYNIVLMAAKNRPMGSFIDVTTDKVVGTVGKFVDCTLTDGTKLLSHKDANTAEGAMKYQCGNSDHGGDQISGHPYWLTANHAVIVDRANRQLSVYKVWREGKEIKSRLLNHMKTRSSIHQIVPRDRSSLPASQQNDFYAVEEGKHADDNLAGGIAHSLLHMKLTDDGLKLVRRLNLQRTKVLPKVKAKRILDACIANYRGQGRNGRTREQSYLDLFKKEGITLNPDQDAGADFPTECFYPGIPGGHNADFAPNNKHVYVGMAGGALSVIDVNRWKIVNNMDIGIKSGPGHTCFSKKHNLALTTNHIINYTRVIRNINSDRPTISQYLPLGFSKKGLINTYQSHTCYIDEKEEFYYNFWTDGGVFYKMNLADIAANKQNGNPNMVSASLETGGIPIQGSFIKRLDIYSDVKQKRQVIIPARRSSETINNQHTETTKYKQ